MQIKLKLRNNFYSVNIGYNSPWHKQIYFITIVQEWYDNPTPNHQTVHASMIFKAFKQRKFK